MYISKVYCFIVLSLPLQPFIWFCSNSKKVKDFSSDCCPDFYKKNDTCQRELLCFFLNRNESFIMYRIYLFNSKHFWKMGQQRKLRFMFSTVERTKLCWTLQIRITFSCLLTSFYVVLCCAMVEKAHMRTQFI